MQGIFDQRRRDPSRGHQVRQPDPPLFRHVEVLRQRPLPIHAQVGNFLTHETLYISNENVSVKGITSGPSSAWSAAARDGW